MDFVWLFLFPAAVIIVMSAFIYFLWATICFVRMLTSIPATLVWGAVFLIFVGIGALLQPGMFFAGPGGNPGYRFTVGLFGLLTLTGAIAVFRRKTWGITLASAAFALHLLGGVLLPDWFNMPGGFLWELLIFPWVLIGLLLSYLKWDYLAALAARPGVSTGASGKKAE
jgi:hypothetical protein